MSRPVLLSQAMPSVMIQLAKTAARQQEIRKLEARIKELQARRAFHLDPTPKNLTDWCDANEALVEAMK